MKINIDYLIDIIFKTVESHKLSDGAYARWLWQDESNTRNLHSSEYGCSDAANILYSIGRFEQNVNIREKYIQELQSFQNPETGLFMEPTHHFMHATAHCTAALELFDARPLYPLKDYEQYKSLDGLYALLDSLNWEGRPWPEAHKGAGIYAAFMNTGIGTLEWQNWYFDWLDSHCDKKYGLSREGAIDSASQPICHHLFGWFHYLFNYSFARRPYPCAETCIDTCLKLYDENMLGSEFGKKSGFCEIDWVYTINRLSSQTGYRFLECREHLRDFARKYFDYYAILDYATDENFNDLHMLFGAVCSMAELQLSLPGEIISTVPLKIVLDRRPFI